MTDKAINIRRTQYIDAATVLQWTNNPAIWAVDNPAKYQPKSIAAFAPLWRAVVDEATTWIIEHNNQPVGHMGWVTHTPNLGSEPSGSEPFGSEPFVVGPVGVREFYIVIGEVMAMGRGVGRDAMNWLLDSACEAGIDTLYGRVLGNNPHALGFFSHLGFAEIGRTENYFERDGMHHDLLWMRYDVSARNFAQSA